MPASDQQRDRSQILAAVERMTRVGLSGYQIAAELGIHHATVYRMRRELQVPSRYDKRPWASEELARAEEMFDDGCSFKEVSRTLGRPLSSVFLRFKGRGWTSKQAAEFQKLMRQFEYRDRLDRSFDD